jgi:cellulose synthase operon protein C
LRFTPPAAKVTTVEARARPRGSAVMSRRLSACLLLVCAAWPARGAPSLKEARLRWLKGNYEEALSQYEELVKDPKAKAPAAVGMSLALASTGEYDKALAAVESALKSLPKDADLLARKAELLHLRGRWAEAEKSADSALAVNPKQFLARWVRAQVYSDRGDVKKADGEFRWFVGAYNDEDIKDPERLLLVGLAACEHARRHHLADQFEFVLKEVYGDAVKADADFWPAEYQAGVLLLEKYNRGEAQEALDNALKINPSCAEALTAKGSAELMRFEVKKAERLAEQALKVNPNLPEALRLRADVHLATGNVPGALKELALARKVNPRDERTLARVAACYHFQRKKGELEALVKEVGKHDSKPALFHFELGERLEDRRHYDEAEKHYKKARDLRPDLPGPLNALGLLYMRLGREADAAPLLEKGFEADRFNVRVSNMRKVLRHLQKYKTLKTEHFEVRYDPAHDPALARYMAEYLEKIHADLAKKFDYRPKGPILVEVFNSHEMFSGRTVALPDLHTIGACTGRMVAMASPHAKGVRRPFNWARVLRHELVHIFNLEQTHFLVPHWLTEGLAVQNEGLPRPPAWNELLRERVAKDDLMNLDNVDLGFIRPRGPDEWHLAYCQSSLYVEYAQKEYGPGVVAKLLAAYADGADTPGALRRACKVEKEAFEKGYRAYVRKVAAGLGGKKGAEKPRTLARLRAEYKKDPNDPDVCAELALRVLPRDRVEARRLAQEALELKRRHPKASYVMARLARAAGDVREERRLLESALDEKDPDPLVLKALGKIYYDAKEFAKAAKVFELGRKVQPHEPDWLGQLVRVYAQSGEKAKQIAALKELVPTDADDFERRERLARLLLGEKKYAEAERYAREALEIDVRSAEAREALVKALKGQGKDAEAERLAGLLKTKGEK